MLQTKKKKIKKILSYTFGDEILTSFRAIPLNPREMEFENEAVLCLFLFSRKTQLKFNISAEAPGATWRSCLHWMGNGA